MSIERSSAVPETRYATLESPSVKRSTSVGSEPTVTCPECDYRFPLTAALALEVEERAKAAMKAEFARREEDIRAEMAKTLATATAEAEARTKETLSTRLADLQAQITEKTERFADAAAVELELRRRHRELEEKEKSLTLEVARQVDAERRKTEQQTTERVAEEYRLRESQMREQLASMTRTIEDLKRKAEQGSQQIQGEALEVELEVSLGHAFVADTISPVAKGVRGADVLHTVRTSSGANCATIVWETKNAKAWSPKWLERVREDQREASADLAVIVTNALPPEIRSFGQVEGVWVCDLATATVLAAALRAQLLAVHRERVAVQGRTTKEAYLYDFITGKEFHQAVAAAAIALARMKKELDQERNAAVRLFAKREKEITNVASHIAGLVGSVHGIVGAALPPIALLEAPQTNDDSDDQQISGLLAS
jgi:hypothetical protein